jgi:hypothetical protein
MFGTGDFPPPDVRDCLCSSETRISKGNSGHSFHVVCSELYNNVVLVAKMTTDLKCARVPLCAHRMRELGVCRV